MAVIHPFCAIHPAQEMAATVAALPYDVMNTEEACAMVQDKPYTFLRIDRAEVNFTPPKDAHDPAVYAKARELLDNWQHDGVLVKDPTPCLYLYGLTMNGRTQTGIVTTTAIDDYLNNVIKKHELTRADKEQDRICHVDTCDANTGPIFLAYRATNAVEGIKTLWLQTHLPIVTFTSEDGVIHAIWKMDDATVVNSLVAAFADVPALYIADGHHRAASAVKVGLKRRAEHPGYTGNEEFNYFLSVIFPDKELAIMDYNRLVKDLNGMTADAFVTALQKDFTVAPVANADEAKPKLPHTFGMYLEGKWYALALAAKKIPADTVAALDVQQLQSRILEPILGIGDIRTDARIDFVGGIRGLAELERRVDNGEMQVAFAMYPTSLAELEQIADEGKLMPPKSTWFEPKLRSGLFIHALK